MPHFLLIQEEEEEEEEGEGEGRRQMIATHKKIKPHVTRANGKNHTSMALNLLRPLNLEIFQARLFFPLRPLFIGNKQSLIALNAPAGLDR